MYSGIQVAFTNICYKTVILDLFFLFINFLFSLVLVLVQLVLFEENFKIVKHILCYCNTLRYYDERSPYLAF